jgi:hypothetical protein
MDAAYDEQFVNYGYRKNRAVVRPWRECHTPAGRQLQKLRGRDVQSVSQETKAPAIPQLVAALIATESGARAI